MRNNNVAKTYVLFKVRIMWYTTGNSYNKNVVDLLESTQQTGSCVAGGCHRFASTAHRWKFGADNTMGANVTKRVDV